jgi:hypothetical protein
MFHRWITGLIACSLAAAASAAPDLSNIPLKWTPKESIVSMGPLDLSGAMLTTKIQFDNFTDTRSDAALVAENREKAAPRAVTTSSDVPEFVADNMKGAMRGLGMSIVDSGGDVILSAELRQFFVAETNVYHGDIALLVHLKNASGKEIWSGVVLGNAEHFGRSYRAENYYETFSDMVLRATFNLLSNPTLHETLAAMH